MPDITITQLASNLNNTRILWDADRKRANMLAKPTPLLDNCRSMSKRGENGGALFITPLDFYNHSTPTRLTGAGFNLIDYDFTAVGYPAQQEWADVVQPIGYSLHEQRINTGAAKVVDDIQQRTDAVKNHMERSLQRALLIQDNAAYVDITPINGDDYSDGAIEALAVGSQNNTLLGISKSTFSDRPGWQNQYATASAAFATYGVQKMVYLQQRCRLRGNAQNTINPPKHIWYVSTDLVLNLKKEVTPLERFAQKDARDLGTMMEVFGNIPLVEIEDDMPTTGPWSALLLDHDKFQYVINGGRDLVQDEWNTMAAARQEAMVSLVGWMGNTSWKYLGTTGLLINANTY